jgi:hypothetical protein
MSVITVTVAQWQALNQTGNFAPGDTYIISDTAKNIRGLSPNDIAPGILTKIESTDASLVLSAAQALAVLNPNFEGEPAPPPYVHFGAPGGDTVECIDTIANISMLSPFYVGLLETVGIQTFAVADTASDIQSLTASQFEYLGQLDVTTITSTDSSVVLSTAEAIDLTNATNSGTIKIVAPTNGTVVVAGTAASLEALSTFQIAALKPLGVQALTVNDNVRPEFSMDQLVFLAEASLTVNESAGIPIFTSDLINDEANPAGLTPGDAYVVVAVPSDFTNNVLSPEVIADAPQQVLAISVDDSVTLSVAQAEALENASLPVDVAKGNTVTLVDSVAALEGMTDNQLSALKFIGVTAVAAGGDTPAVFSADQMQALQLAGVVIVAPPDNENQNDGSYDVFNPNGLTLDITWDSSVASAPADFEQTVEHGVKILEQAITNKITVDIAVGYGEYGNDSLLPGGISEGGPQEYALSYSDLRSLLALEGTTAAAILGVNSLPNTLSLDGQSNFFVGTAEAKALGLLNNDGSVTPEGLALGLSDDGGSPDGWTGFGTGFTSTGLIDAALHEIAHAMGRFYGTSALSLYRYTVSNGQAVHYFQGGNPPPDAAPSYFSIDGGVTKIADFGETSDPSDFLNSPASSLTPNDPFDEFVAGDGDLTPQDLVMLNVLGFQINPVESFTANDIEAFSSSDLGLLASVGVFEIKPLDSLVTLNVAQVETWENLGLVSILASAGGIVALVDTAADIEGLSVLQLDGLASIGVNLITVTDGASLKVLDAAALEFLYAVAVGEGSITPLPPTAPGGGGLTIVDTIADIELLSAEGLDELASINVTKIIATDGATLKVADAETLETTYAAAAALGAPPLPLSAPGGGGLTVVDTVADIAGMSAEQLGALSSIGVTAINPIGGVLDVADAETLETTYAAAVALGTPPIPLSVPGGGGVTVVDTDAAIEGMSAGQIAALPSIGISAIAPSTVTTLVLNIAQGVAIEDASLTLELPPFVQGGALQFADTAANIEAFSTNAAQFLALSNLALADGATELVAENGPVVLSVAGALAFVDAPFRLIVPQGSPLIVADAPGAIDGLTTTEIGELAALGVSELDTSVFTLDVAQIGALENAGITLSTAPLLGTVTIQDTAEQIETLTAQQIDGLAGPYLVQIQPTTGPQSPLFPIVTFNVAQFQAFESLPYIFTVSGIRSPGGSTRIAIADTASNIEMLTADQLVALGNDFANQPITITVTAGAALVLDLAQALAALGPYFGASGGPGIQFGYDASQLPGLTFTVADTAADFEALTTSQVDTLSHIDLTGPSFTVMATDASVVLSTAQATAAASDGLSIAVPTGDTVSIGDTADDIRDFLDHGAAEVSQVEQVLNISGIAATDRAVALTASQAEALEAANAASGLTVAVTAPSGDSVTLADNAADIALMSPTQLTELPSIGVTAITVTDQSVTLSIAQALALYGVVPISVPTGDQIIISDTETAIDSLTPTTLAELASIGAQTIEIGPLTIAGGETLSIDGPVPSYQTITFAGAGGTLGLDDTADMAGTIYGFSPPDTIDLTDVPYDSSGNGFAQLDPNDGQQAIQVFENGNTYYLDIDPSQVFLTGETFALTQDGGGTGSGTDLTVVEPPVTAEQLQVFNGQTSDGVVIGGGGGGMETEFGAVVNRAVIQNGGTLTADFGSTVNDTSIDSGGLLDLTMAAAASGTISFGPPVADPVGGTLEIGDAAHLDATILGFADGDTIDLTEIQYDQNGSADLVPSTNVLDVNEDGTTYTLQFDPSQDFTGEYFHLAPDADIASPGTDITENSTPCYCRGTLIAAACGPKCVEALEIGEKVMTMSGAMRPIKWIGRRSYAGRFIMGREDILPICIRAGALADNVPKRDLWISPHHAVYLEGVLIEVKDLVNGVSVVQAERVDKVEYFHIELESHDVIIAEGALSETFIDDDSRAMFHNAHDYDTLYAEEHTAPAHYCAPRVDEGYEVEAVRQRLAQRAGLLRDAYAPQVSVLRGYIDRIRATSIAGWAQNADAPEAPVCLDIFADGKLIGQVLANSYRDDLKCAGLGSGHHAFTFTRPPGFVFASDAVEVRRSLDGAALSLSAHAKRTPASTAA